MKKIYLIIFCSFFSKILVAQVGIGTTNPNANSILEVSSTSQGVKFPRLTSAERKAISSPAKGLAVFDTDLDCLMVNFGTPSSPSWKCLGGLHIIGNTDFGTLIRGVGYSTNNAYEYSEINYSSSSGVAVSAQAIASTGVTGLTANIAATNLLVGSGIIKCVFSGTPTNIGTASFSLNIGGTSYTLTREIVAAGTITTLDATTPNHTGTLETFVTSMVYYTGGNGGPYAASLFNSTGVSGLTAQLGSGTFASGNGTLLYTIYGTPSGVGSANFSISIGGRSTTLSYSVLSGSIETLEGANPTNSGSLISGVTASGVSSIVTYTGGSGGPHNGQIVASTGITGLTATLQKGTFAIGAGSLVYNISGTPSGAGTASFALDIGGQTVTLERAVVSGSISTLASSAPTNFGSLVDGVAANAVTSTIPYEGGNSGPHSGQTVISTGVTGLTATLSAGNFSSGYGNLSYIITGTPAGNGIASFALNIGGQNYTLDRNVDIGRISTLTLSTNVGTLTVGVDASGVTSNLSYTAGNGGAYSGQIVNSTGVSGLTATLSSGNFQVGSGVLTYTITGIPNSGGTASFALSVGGRNFTLTRSVSGGGVGTLTTNAPINSGAIIVGVPISGSSVSSEVSYTSGSGSHSGQVVASTGVTGLTATLSSGTFSTSGALTYVITGTPNTTGTASFAIDIGGKTGTLLRYVEPTGFTCGISSITFEYMGKLVTYGTIERVYTPNFISTGTQTSGSVTITLNGNDAHSFLVEVGQSVNGRGIPDGTTVTNKNGNSITISQAATSTFAGNTAILNFYGGSTKTKCWMDRNLGASRVAINESDALAYGDLFQWGRGADGHQLISPLSSLTTTRSISENPGHGLFINTLTNPRTWQQTTNSNLWQGVNGINNPCPIGWRVPVISEFVMESVELGDLRIATFPAAFNSPLKFTKTGIRQVQGNVGNTTCMALWTSTPIWGAIPSNGKILLKVENQTAYGGTVRCIKD